MISVSRSHECYEEDDAEDIGIGGRGGGLDEDVERKRKNENW
jgi:hypothetical protein